MLERHVLSGFIALACLMASACAPAKVEPTTAEMRSAYEGVLEFQFKRNAKGDFIVENSLNGMAIRIKSFDKLACKAEEEAPSYVCTFRVAASMGAFSNEGSVAGDRHAAAVTALMSMAGSQHMVDTMTGRFTPAEDGWTLAIFEQ